MECPCSTCPTTRLLYEILKDLDGGGGLADLSDQLIPKVKEFITWYEKPVEESRIATQDYALTTIKTDLSSPEIELPAGAKILEVFYEVHAEGLAYKIGSSDRLLIFHQLKEAWVQAKVQGREKLEGLKLQYGMPLPDPCFTGEVKRVIKALVPKYK